MKIGYRHMGKYKGTEAIQNSIDISQQGIELALKKDEDIENKISILEKGIDLSVKKDNVIADLNLAVKDGKGVVELEGNVVKIKSDNFTLDENGRTEQTSGNIGGWEINRDGLLGENGKGIYYDGHATIYTCADLLVIKFYILGQFELTGSMLEHYDLNGDGVVNTQDYMRLKRMLGFFD